jgi:hypothetical protein
MSRMHIFEQFEIHIAISHDIINEMTKESFKIKIQGLFDKLNELLSYFNQTKRYVSDFETFTDTCIQRLLVLLRKALPSSVLVPHLENYIKTYWLHHYIAVKDEIAVLIKGELQRKYHRREHTKKKYIHVRGHEQIYFLDKYELSSCSCDGFDYEYRKLCDEKPDHPKLERLATSLDDINAKIQVESDRIDSCFWKLKAALSEFPSISSIDISCLHNNEFIKIFFTDESSKPLKMFRSDIPMDDTREQAFSSAIEDLEGYEDLTALPLKRVSGHASRSANTVVDSDDEMDPDSNNENKAMENILANYQEASIKGIKLGYGVNEDERDKYDSDGNMIDDATDSMAQDVDNASAIQPIVTKKKKQKGDNAIGGPLAPETTINLDGYLIPKISEHSFIIKVIDPKANGVTFFDLPLKYYASDVFLAPGKFVQGNVLLAASLMELWTGAMQRAWIPMDIVLIAAGNNSYDHSKHVSCAYCLA